MVISGILNALVSCGVLEDTSILENIYGVVGLVITPPIVESVGVASKGVKSLWGGQFLGPK